jgi:ribosomal protein L35
MRKAKTLQTIAKRFKKTHPKKGRAKLIHQSVGRGTKHLKTKQSNARKRRIRQVAKYKINKSVRRVMSFLK